MNISVIIPTLNEEQRIARLIAETRELGDCEIVVVDGDSDDNTWQQSATADVRLHVPRGRAHQQNAGARNAHGDVLLFLHADCRLSPGSLESIRTALADSRCVGGCFRQRIEADALPYRLLEWGNAWRVRMCGWAYGDQGIFVRRTVFDTLGGFPPLAFMEDLYFMKRLKRQGRLALLDGPISVSPRRWQQQGIVRQTLRNWTLIGLAHCGVSPDRLANWYRHVRD